MDRLLTTSDAAEKAGVGPTAIKRWADEGLLPCVRTAGGHRRFEEAALAAFLKGQATRSEQGSDAERFVDRLLDAESGQQVEAQLLVLRGREGAWQRVAPLLGGVFVEIGARWEKGELSLIEEHVVSERLLRAITRISEAIPVAPQAPLALLAAVEGDDHVLGLSTVELCLREAGFRTRWAGRAAPLEEVVGFIQGDVVDMLAVSASSASTDAKKLKRYALRVAEVCEAHEVKLLLGGSGAWPSAPRYGIRLCSFEELNAFLAAG